tara:strand:+ start:1152 stop:1724 length:573 start_codon:yes stop_codon:yes gene_type:complete
MARFKKIHNIVSEIATSNNINNYPGVDVDSDPLLTADFIWGNLTKLHTNCIIPILEEFGSNNIKITSAYRCKELNLFLGGTENSQHTKGYAIDLVSSTHASSLLWNWCFQNLSEWHQLIWEYPERGNFINANHNFSWVHISYIEGNNPKTCSFSSEVDSYHEHYKKEEIEPVMKRGNYTHGITFANETII